MRWRSRKGIYFGSRTGQSQGAELREVPQRIRESKGSVEPVTPSVAARLPGAEHLLPAEHWYQDRHPDRLSPNGCLFVGLQAPREDSLPVSHHHNTCARWPSGHRGGMHAVERHPPKCATVHRGDVRENHIEPSSGLAVARRYRTRRTGVRRAQSAQPDDCKRTAASVQARCLAEAKELEVRHAEGTGNLG